MMRGGAARTRPCLLRGIAAALAVVLAPGILAAQTPVTAIGLGYPPPALDGRAAALGGTGIGLIGGSFSSRNPADLTMFGNPALGATLAPEGVTLKTPEGNQSTGRSRFVVLQGVLPVDRWSFGFNISSELDQDWDVVLADTLRTGFGDYPYVERRQHDGGLSSIGVSAAYQFGPLSVGAEGSVLSGNLRQLFRRTFDPAVGDPSNQIGSAAGDARWAYRGWRWRVGLSGAVGRRATLSASITSYSQLQARKDTFGVAIGTQYFDMPFEVAGGGSVLVTDRLLLAVGAGWNGWSGTDFRLYNTQAADVFWAGGGLEYVGFRMLNLPVPLRIGYRYTDLPFYDGDYEQLSETAVTFGFGTRLAGGRAVVDLGVEIGSRGQLEKTGVEESFQRFSLTIGINAL
ncbi:MAG: hypothetical protein Q8W46_05055 [Candidatus Palauibacterales bacterium]|nr:hypothetical protein [Candidatus Palauibacterales bacterium]